MQESSSATDVARSTPPKQQRSTAAATVVKFGNEKPQDFLISLAILQVTGMRCLACWLHSIVVEDDEMAQRRHQDEQN